MIFSELYSAYYNTVAAVLRAACEHPLEKGELRRIIGEKAFGESALNIAPALAEERWQLLRADGTTPIAHAPTMPLTTLQLRWLKAISLDPRVRLFPEAVPDLPDVEPLFTPADYTVFDRYADGDPYADEAYIRHFRLILRAIRERTPLEIESATGRGSRVRRCLMPEYLEYSEKDDKFRLIGSGCRWGNTINLGRILACAPSERPLEPGPAVRPEQAAVELELRDRRNALERVMMHFAHFEKEAERLDGDRYRLRVIYDREDETEMVIRILAFGPMLRVTAPEDFAELIRERLRRQKMFLS